MRREFFGVLFAAIAFLPAKNAGAADLPTKAPPPMAVATPWTGFYVNGGIGYGAWVADETVLLGAGPACVTCITQYQGGKGFLGTIGLGYDYQLMPRVVVGVFGDYSLSSLEGTIQDGQPFFTGQIKETSSWALGARVGLLAGSKTLSYINGGYTGARFSGATIVSSITGASAGLSTQAFTTDGWFLGGGVEMALMPGWFWRTEYRYSYYSSRNLPELTAAGVLGGDTFVFKPTVQSITTQLVFKFNGGLPAPAFAPVAAAAAKWTGLYVNGGYGYGLWTARENSVDPVTGLCLICVVQTQGGKGYLGRVGAGYDWQFAPMWLVGVFGDVDWSSLKGTLQDHIGFGAAISGDIKQTSAWAVGPRFGWLMSPGTMAYVNGGFTGARFSGVTMFFIPFPGGLATGTSTQPFTTDGWFVGGGIETAFDLFGLLPPGFFLRSEYRYANYANKTLADPPGASINFKPVVQSITSSLIFKFN